MSGHTGTAPEGISRRRLLAYLVAAPTLTMVVKWADVVGVLDPSTPAGASPTPADVVDLTDALTLAARPTAYLLRIEVTTEGRVVLGVPRAEVGQGITTACAVIVADDLSNTIWRITPDQPAAPEPVAATAAPDPVTPPAAAPATPGPVTPAPAATGTTAAAPEAVAPAAGEPATPAAPDPAAPGPAPAPAAGQ